MITVGIPTKFLWEHEETRSDQKMGKGAPQIHNSLSAGEGKYAIVVARWNEAITSELRDGAVQTLKTHGATDDQIEVHYVPGSFELPMLADKLSSTKRYAAIICLGTVIQGRPSIVYPHCRPVRLPCNRAQGTQKMTVQLLFHSI